MDTHDHTSRRQFLGRAVALGALGLAGPVDRSSAAPAERKPARAGGKLPARGEFVIRNAHVMTMDPTLGDVPRGDVHVRRGEIVAVGADLKAPGAEVIDGRGMIVLPGL